MALLPLAAAEGVCLRLRAAGSGGALFVTARIGPLLADGSILLADSVKVLGSWDTQEDLCWVVQDLPLQAMAARSPVGLVACRFKLWVQGSISRWWLGRTAPTAVPAPAFEEALGTLRLVVEIQRGSAVQAAEQREATRTFGASGLELPPRADEPPPPPSARTFGSEILRAATLRQWGLAAALMEELQLAPKAPQKQAMALLDSTRRSALRLLVDGQFLEQAPLRQALETSVLTAVLMGGRRPYLCRIHIRSINQRSTCWLGEQHIGMPRPWSGLDFWRPWVGPAGAPAAGDCSWGEPKDVQGDVEISSSSAGPNVGHLRMGCGTDLSLDLAPPGAPVPFGSQTFSNPLGVPMLVARGRIDGVPALGVFDQGASARLAVEAESCGPGEAAQLAVSCGASPRALADDGLSPFTAALLGKDPCGLLGGVSRRLRARILRDDALAWAELSRGSIGAGHPDMAAAPLMRHLAVTDEMAQSLFEHCLRENLPLVATRALDRIGGQRHLLAVLERASGPLWLRVAERILAQMRREERTFVISQDVLEKAIVQIRRGQPQFRLLLQEFVAQVRRAHDFHAQPAALDPSAGAECAICFEPLCRGAAVAFADTDSRIVCPHFLHPACARGIAASSSAATGSTQRCPECRRFAPKVMPLPDLAKDPLGWFDFLASASGTLPRATLLRAVSAMLPVDPDDLAAALDEGTLTSRPVGQEITAVEFFSGGLFSWVWRHDEEHRLLGRLGAPPDFGSRGQWFRHWNVAGNGRLSQGEVLRAVLQALGVSSLDAAKVAALRARADAAWDGHARLLRRRQPGWPHADGVSLADFEAPGGLADVLEEAFGMELCSARAPPTARGPDGVSPRGYAVPLRRGRGRREQLTERARAICTALARQQEQELDPSSLNNAADPAPTQVGLDAASDAAAPESSASGSEPAVQPGLEAEVRLPLSPGAVLHASEGTAPGAGAGDAPARQALGGLGCVEGGEDDPRTRREDISRLDALASLEVLELGLQSDPGSESQEVISI